ncbi:MAG TPA: LamG domain-containing protein [Kofleriaceae bacterium]|nr:LamG domain-containing protein [Kofleriaceae bacterium]
MTARRVALWVGLSACGHLGFDSGNDDGLVGWWRFEEGSGTTAHDSSGHGHDGTLSAGITWTTGRIGGAIELDGAQNHQVDLGRPVELMPSGSMTVAAWINAQSFKLGGLADDVVISRDSAAAPSDHGWELKGSEDCGQERAVLQIAVASNAIVEQCGATVLATSTWYHLAGVYDAEQLEMHVYVNGVLDDGMLTASVPGAQHEPTVLVDVQIGNASPSGGASTGGGDAFTGLLDEVRMYDRALSATEIAGLAAD